MDQTGPAEGTGSGSTAGTAQGPVPFDGEKGGQARRIADDEVRRELIRNNATAGLGRLDRLGRALEYAAITTAVMREAAELWAQARRAGIPTADPKALDGDSILAAQALLAGGATDDVTVAASNLGHPGRCVDAQLWESIT